MNEYTSEQRKNPYSGAKLKRNAQQLIELSIRSQMRGLKITKPVVLEYHFYEANRKRDHDNVSGFAHKVTQDALVAQGVLRDDGWDEILGYSDSFTVDKANPRIEVLIKEVDADG